MKTQLLTFALLLSIAFTQAQTLNEVFSKYIQPTSSTAELWEGLQKIEDLCSTTPEDKCNKAKASAYYLIADDYYEAAYNVFIVDAELAKPILDKAKSYYDTANAIMPINEFTEIQKNMMLDQKHKLEASPKFNLAKS